MGAGAELGYHCAVERSCQGNLGSHEGAPSENYMSWGGELFGSGGIEKLLFGNPIGRTAGIVLSSLAGSIIGGWWIADLSAGGSGVNWSNWDTSGATLAVSIYAVILLVYTTAYFNYEKGQDRWGNPQYRKARLYEDLWPVMIERMADHIRTGRVIRMSDLEKEVDPGG